MDNFILRIVYDTPKGIQAQKLIFMKISISIPDNLFYQAETYAHQQGLSRSRLYSRALAVYLARVGDQDDDPVTVKLNQMAKIINGSELSPSKVTTRRLIDSGSWEW